MTPVEALHTAARRYCMDEALLWHERYAKGRADPNSEEARAVYPRYHVLEAVLVGVERATPDEFCTVADALEWLLLAGEAAQSGFTLLPPHQQGAARDAMDEERARFAQFVRDFAARPQQVEPLPFRRTLSQGESRALWSALDARWRTQRHGYWYPLSGVAPPNARSVVVVRADAFEECSGPERLKRLLLGLGQGCERVRLGLGHEHVFELNEMRGREEPEYEVEVALVDGLYRLSETYWTPPDLEWLI